MMDEVARISVLERQMAVIENNMATFQAQLAAMERDASKHRAEERAALDAIAKSLKEIKHEQILERGRREGAALTKAPLGEWGRTLLPIAVAAAVFMFASYIDDRVPPAVVVNPPAIIKPNEAAP